MQAIKHMPTLYVTSGSVARPLYSSFLMTIASRLVCLDCVDLPPLYVPSWGNDVPQLSTKTKGHEWSSRAPEHLDKRILQSFQQFVQPHHGDCLRVNDLHTTRMPREFLHKITGEVLHRILIAQSILHMLSRTVQVCLLGDTGFSVSCCL
jgi:hypothetical protein